jgi:hypothetical protein
LDFLTVEVVAAATLGVEFNLAAPSFEDRPVDAVDVVERREDDVTVRGEMGTGAGSGGFGDGVRPTTGGASFGDDVPEDASGGLGVEGLLQDVKKSSSSGLIVSWADSTPSTTIPFGNLPPNPTRQYLAKEKKKDRQTLLRLP